MALSDSIVVCSGLHDDQLLDESLASKAKARQMTPDASRTARSVGGLSLSLSLTRERARDMSDYDQLLLAELPLHRPRIAASSPRSPQSLSDDSGRSKDALIAGSRLGRSREAPKMDDFDGDDLDAKLARLRADFGEDIEASGRRRCKGGMEMLIVLGSRCRSQVYDYGGEGMDQLGGLDEDLNDFNDETFGGGSIGPSRLDRVTRRSR